MSGARNQSAAAACSVAVIDRVSPSAFLVLEVLKLHF
jgi:hypothetical protein